MGCGCKNIKKVKEKYSENENKTLKNKIFDFSIKMGLFLITIVLALMIIPIILIIGLFKAFFMKDKTIRVPKFLINPKKYING